MGPVTEGSRLKFKLVFDYIIIGFLPIHFHLENCSINISTLTISIECTYPSNSLATGFLMLVQLGDPDQVYKLYVNQTRDKQRSVTVEVEENGTYLVSVIPVFEKTGIIGSNVEYREEIVLPFTSGNLHANDFCRLHGFIVKIM